jgi:hypothetical protein
MGRSGSDGVATMASASACTRSNEQHPPERGMTQDRVPNALSTEQHLPQAVAVASPAAEPAPAALSPEQPEAEAKHDTGASAEAPSEMPQFPRAPESKADHEIHVMARDGLPADEDNAVEDEAAHDDSSYCCQCLTRYDCIAKFGMASSSFPFYRAACAPCRDCNQEWS